MANEIKFSYIAGQQLVFSCYSPDGTGRGIGNQPLDELAEGYYAGSPLVDLVAGDEIIACVLDNVVSGVSRVGVLYYDSIVSDGVRVSSNGNWVITKDSQSSQPVVSTGEVVGGQEFTMDAEDYAGILDTLTDLGTQIAQTVAQGGTVITVTDESGGSQAQAAELARQLEEQDVGYFRRKRLERYG